MSVAGIAATACAIAAALAAGLIIAAAAAVYMCGRYMTQ